MADKTILKFEVDSNIKDATKDVKKLDKATDDAKGSFGGLKKVIQGIGTALKAAGIGLALAAFAKLFEVFSKNQKTIDFFNTSMTALDIAFGDLIETVGDNADDIGTWYNEYFGADAQSDVLTFSTVLKTGLVEAFNQVLVAYEKFFAGFATLLTVLAPGTWQEKADRFNKGMTSIAKGSVGLFTGFDDAEKKDYVGQMKDYVTELIKVAEETTKAGNTAQIAAVQIAGLNAEQLAQAEILRQTRDDFTKTYAERIKANEDLGAKLKEMLESQQALAAAEVHAAQLAKNAVPNLENTLRLMEAENKQLEIKEALTGLESEQLQNKITLEKELADAKIELELAGTSAFELEMAELQAAYDLKIDLARRAGEETTAIEKEFNQKRRQLAAENTATMLEAYSALAGGLAALAGDNKELAIAQAIIDTYAGATKALSLGPAGFIQAAAIIAAGFANVRKIMETDIPGDSGGGGGGIPGGGQEIAPQMMGGTFDLTGGLKPEPVQAYVVSDDITNNQDKLAAIRRRATI
jgi:hypothetical protein